MATRQYRIEAIHRRGPRSSLRRRARVKLTRLDDGRVFEVSIAIRQDVGEVVAIDDDQVYFGIWKP